MRGCLPPAVAGLTTFPGATLGPATTTIVCGVSASMLRPKTLALARCAYDLLSFVQAAAGPYMLDPRFGNLEGFTAFPAAGCTAALLVWSFFRLPKIDGIPAPLLDVLFARRVPARQFADQAAELRAEAPPSGAAKG